VYVCLALRRETKRKYDSLPALNEEDGSGDRRRGDGRLLVRVSDAFSRDTIPVACGAEAQSANKHKIIFLKHKMKLGTIAALSMAVASEVTMFIYLAPAVLSL
jgi:hypothetical protein